jgi:hypothetical protein
MIDRRNVLKLGAAALGGALAGGAEAAVRIGSDAGPNVLFRAIFDERFADCIAFASELDLAGVATTGIRGDVAQLWYGDLRSRLGRTRAPIAGLTDRVALFCLEELARDVGMRVSMRIDHLIDRSGLVQHVAHGSVQLAAAIETLESRAGFGPAMAALVNQHAATNPRLATAQKRTGPSSPAGKTALVSWVIA